MAEPKAERVGTALRRMAEDLVAERRRVAALERENRRLRAQVEALTRLVGDPRELTSRGADTVRRTKNPASAREGVTGQ